MTFFVRATLSACVVACAVSTASAASARKPRGDCRLDKADTIVHGVKLGDSDGGKKILGDRMTTKLHMVEREGGDFPWYVFISQNGSQTAAFRTHPGDVVNSYNEIEVRYRRIGQKQLFAKEESYYIGREGTPPALPTEAFVSGSGIKLGMTKADVVKRIGRCFKVIKTRGQAETIRYEVEDESAQLPVLKGANMPSYYAEYQFERGKLVRFRIGHDYP